MSIDRTNYNNATIGKFKSIPRGWAQALTTVGINTPCFLGGRIWKLDTLTWGRNGESFSANWISDDNEHLIRISDRWSYFSKRKHKKEGLIKSKRLRPCIWSMKQKPHVVEIENGCNGKLKVAGGYIRFDKMQKNEDVK